MRGCVVGDFTLSVYGSDAGSDDSGGGLVAAAMVVVVRCLANIQIIHCSHSVGNDRGSGVGKN